MTINDYYKNYEKLRYVRFRLRLNRKLYEDLQLLSDKTGVFIPDIIEHQIELLMLKPYVQDILNDKYKPISAMPKTTPCTACGA